MRSNIPTLLSLWQYAEIMGFNPWEMAQIEYFPTRVDARCEDTFFQHPYQTSCLSRDDLANSIRKAETMIAQHLGYYPAPTYITNEPRQYPRPANKYGYGNGLTPRGQNKPIRLEWGYVNAGGVLARTEIDAAVMLTFADTDGDGYMDTFTGSFATTVTDATQIGMYFNATDRLGRTLDETWRIRPIEVTIAAGTATITGPIQLLVLPELQEPMNAVALNPANHGTIYATELEAYRVYTDTTATNDTPSQGIAIWDPTIADCPDGDCLSPTGAICLRPYEETYGLVSIDILPDGTCWPDNREPDRVTVNYNAGIPLQSDGRMAYPFANAVAWLATAIAPQCKKGCERTVAIFARWQGYPSDQMERARPLTVEETNAKWGPISGARAARELLEDMLNLTAV